MRLRKCETWKKCGDLDWEIFKCGDLDLEIFAVLVMDFVKFWKSANPSVGNHFSHIFIRIFLTHSHWNWVMHAVSLFETIACQAANDSIPRATTIPKKSNPWFDEECREALKARRALDKRVRQSRELRGETLSAFRRSQAQARRLFNQKKRQSWAEYVSKLSTNTPIKHVWDRVRKICGKNICPPKQNGKDGAAITNPKDIANEHAAAFTDNSSSAHYSATFQTVKVQEEKVKIDFTSDNTEVYNKPFRLRDLRRSIMKAKPRAPGPDGIHNNLLKHLPEDTLKILKEILNKIWISADFPQQWRAATVIPIPKPNKDHTDPLSYRPIALMYATSGNAKNNLYATSGDTMYCTPHQEIQNVRHIKKYSMYATSGNAKTNLYATSGDTMYCTPHQEIQKYATSGDTRCTPYQ